MLLLHLNVVSAFEGDRMAVNCPVAPLVRVNEDGDRVTFVGSGATTVTVAVAVFPFDAVAVTVTLPFATPVTVPLFETVTILVSEHDQLTLLSVAFSGETEAVRFTVAPIVTWVLAGVTFTFVTSMIFLLTVTVAVAVLLLPVVTLIVAEPSFTAVTLPF